MARKRDDEIPSLTAEIHALMDEQLANGIAVDADTLTAALTKSHKNIKGSDKMFWMNLGYPTMRDHVRNAIGRLDPDKSTGDVADDTPQLSLPGWSRLQRGYFMKRVDRFGQEVDRIVPIDQLTPSELRARAALHRAIAKGNIEHAQELEQYADQIEHAKAAE